MIPPTSTWTAQRSLTRYALTGLDRHAITSLLSRLGTVASGGSTRPCEHMVSTASTLFSDNGTRIATYDYPCMITCWAANRKPGRNSSGVGREWAPVQASRSPIMLILAACPRPHICIYLDPPRLGFHLGSRNWSASLPGARTITSISVPRFG